MACSINNSTNCYSDYVLNLDVTALARYVKKLRGLPDPYYLKKGWSLDLKNWPDVIYTDIYFYLVESQGVYTHQSLKAYKSLQAYEYVKSGHVHPIEYHQINEECKYCFLKTKVIPSQFKGLMP